MLPKENLSDRESLHQNIDVATIGRIEMSHIFQNLLLFVLNAPEP